VTQLTRLLTLALLAAALAPAAAAASPLTWSASTPINAQGDANGISCPTASLCVVGADNGEVSVSTNPTATTPTWTAFTLPTTSSSGFSSDLHTIACPSTTLCVTTAGVGNVFTSDDPVIEASWAKHVLPDGAHTNPPLISRLSCPSAGLCVGWDESNSTMLTTTSPAGAWQADAFDYDVDDVSCTAGPARCIAPSGSAIAHTTQPGGGFDKWTTVTHIGYCWPDLSPSCDTIEAVACVPSFCIAGGHGTAGKNGGLYWTDKPLGTASDWQTEPSFTTEVRNMACSPGGARCVASTDIGQYVWDSTNPTGGKTAWAVTPHATTNGLVAQVSCPDEHTCFLASDTGFLSVGRDGSTGGPGGGGDPGGGAGGVGSPSPGGPGGPGGPGAGSPPLVIPPFPPTRVSTPSGLDSGGGSMTIVLRNASDSLATVRIVSRRPLLVWISKKAKARVRTFGTAKVRLKANVAKKVKVKLTKAAKRYFKRHAKVKLRVLVTTTSATGAKRTTTKNATVKRKKR
jgi:hypothetical protein